MTAAQDKRWRAEVDIIEEIGKVPSSREMQRLLKERGIKVSSVIVSKDLQKDLETLTESEYKNQKTGILAMLDNLISIANGIAEKGDDDKIRLDAMKTISKLDKTKSDILIKFRKAQVELNKEDKPIYNVFIGKPKKIRYEIIKTEVKNMGSFSRLLLLGGPVGTVFAAIIVAAIMLVLMVVVGPLLMIGILMLVIGLLVEIATQGHAKEGHILLGLGCIITVVAFWIG